MRETEILVEKQPPIGVLICNHAGLVINIFSPDWRGAKESGVLCTKQVPTRAMHSIEPRRAREENTARDQPPRLLLVKSVHLFAVPRQVAGLREGLAAGGAGVGAVAGMGAHVPRQVAGLREGLAAGGAGVGAVA